MLQYSCTRRLRLNQEKGQCWELSGSQLAKSDRAKRAGCVFRGACWGHREKIPWFWLSVPHYSVAQQQRKPQAEPSRVPRPTSTVPSRSRPPAGSIQQGARGDQGWTPDVLRPNSGSKSLGPSVSMLPPLKPPEPSRLKSIRKAVRGLQLSVSASV